MFKNILGLNIYKNTIFSILFILISIIFIYSFLDRLNSDQRLNYKYTYYAIPISISNTLGESNFYTQYDSIRKKIPNETHELSKKDLNPLIKSSFEEIPKGAHAHAVPGAEDIGLVDYVTYSFAIFGKNIDSIFKFYLLIFMTSIFIFFINFYNKGEFYLVTIPFISVLIIFIENFSFPSAHPEFTFDRFTDTRHFSILCLIPYLHICCYFFFNPSVNYKNIILLTIQILILNFIFFCRIALLLEIVLMISIFITYLFYAFIKSKENFRSFNSKIENKSKINIVIILIFCVFILPNINNFFLTKMYSEYIGDRHPINNMLRAGIMFDNPNLKEKYGFRFGHNAEGEYQGNIDVSINESGKKFYDEHYNPLPTLKSLLLRQKSKKQVFYPDSGVNGVEQARMERYFILHLIVNDFGEIVKNFIIYKPKKIIEAVQKEIINYKTEINFLKILTFFSLSIFLILLTLDLYKTIFLFFLIILPVTIKNMLFWGLANVYFLDLFIFYILGFILLVYLSVKIILNIFIDKKIKNDNFI